MISFRLQHHGWRHRGRMNQDIQLGFRAKLLVAFTLTTVGGFVDAVGYIALFQVFTANMSGNSIHVGMGAGQFSLNEIQRPVCAILSYVVGLIMTRIALEVAARSAWERIASFTLAAEAFLLLLFAHSRPAMHAGQIADLSSPGYFVLVAMLAFAMGIQTATLTHIGPLTLYTTFVTGTLTKFSESFTRSLFWAHDTLERGASLSQVAKLSLGQADVQSGATLLSVWSCYVVGAALGTITKARWELRALYFPVAVLLTLIVLDWLRPLAKEEERHQHAGSSASIG